MHSARLEIGLGDTRVSVVAGRDPTALVGFWSAVATAAAIAIFDLTFAFSFAGIDGTLAAVVASLAIAPGFVVLLVALHQRAAEHQRVWTGAGLAFAVIYATLIILNYMLQLTVVRHSPEAYPWLSMAFTGESAFWAFEVFGYQFMSLAAVLALPTMRGRFQSVLPWLFGVNLATSLAGLVAYVITSDPVHPMVLFGLGSWAILFLAGIVVVALQFRDDGRAETTTR